MTTDKLRIDKNKLSDINQRISLLKRKHHVFNELNGKRNEANILKAALDEKNNEMTRLLNEFKQLKNTIQAIASSANAYNISSMQSLVKKYSEEIDLKSAQLAQLDEDIPIIKAKLNSCDTPEYLQYCYLVEEKSRLELLIKNEESRQSLLTTFCYDAKQRRLLPLNIKEELAHHLGTEWGANLMKKYADLSVSYLPDKVQVVNANNEPEISTDEKGGLCMYKRPSQNEKLADLMVEMYFKAIEDRIGKVHIHQASGPDADFMAKKIALGLQQRGYLDNRVNGQLVTDILGIKKEIEQPASAPVDAATATPPSPSAATTDHHKALNPLQEEEKRTSPTTSTSNQSEPELPDWYIKQLEADKLAENDSSPSLKMR